MATIYIYNYNNYYNRRVKGQNNSLSDYGTPIYVETGDNVNFNPNDGVMTTYTAGRINNAYNGRGDYLVYSEDNVSISSRWFILDAKRTRKGQYAITLRRDVVVDNFDSVLTSKSFIQKATLTDDNPLILTQEAISTNQIKTRSSVLCDDTYEAWIVGYIARNTDEKTIQLDSTTVIPDYTTADLEAWKTTYNFNAPIYNASGSHFDFKVNVGVSSVCYRDFSQSSDNTLVSGQSGYNITQQYNFNSWLNSRKSSIKETLSNYRDLYRVKTSNTSGYDTASAMSGKIVHDTSNDKYYKIETKLSATTDKVKITTNKQGTYLYEYLNQLFSENTYHGGTNAIFQIAFEYQVATVSLVEIAYGKYNVTIPSEVNRYHLKDAPYDMFAIPYIVGGPFATFKLNGIEHNNAISLTVAQEIARSLASQCYDLQLLPYCPFTGYTMNEFAGYGGTNEMTLADISNKRLTPIKDNNNKTAAYMVWCTSSTGSKYVSTDIMPSYENRKISNQCDTYRLVSPNYNGQFEFNIAKLDLPDQVISGMPTGKKILDTFIVDYTYLPYNPFIRVAPRFSGLYGTPDKDARGLICGGDFSISYLSDAWRNYQIQNKNYQNIFDRQIQNMEVNRKYQSIEEVVGAFAGSFQTSAQGFMATGGSPIGAIVGGTAGLMGGLADVDISRAKYQEQKSYATDIHNMQLENIKALPYSIAKTTAFNAINKIIPVLEYYTCTDTEKLVVANEVANRGMTVGAVGQILDYIYNDWSYNDIHDRGFVRASLIDVDIIDDTHIANAISEELQKGVYFK